MSKSVQCASGANVTRTSTSLSQRKSSRSTEPKKKNSVICQRWQNSRSFSLSISIPILAMKRRFYAVRSVLRLGSQLRAQVGRVIGDVVGEGRVGADLLAVD